MPAAHRAISISTLLTIVDETRGFRKLHRGGPIGGCAEPGRRRRARRARLDAGATIGACSAVGRPGDSGPRDGGAGLSDHRPAPMLAATPNQSCRSARHTARRAMGGGRATAGRERPPVRQQAGGRLLGLLRLLAGRSRRAPGGPHDDAGIRVARRAHLRWSPGVRGWKVFLRSDLSNLVGQACNLFPNRQYAWT